MARFIWLATLFACALVGHARADELCGNPGEHPGCEKMVKDLEASSAEHNGDDNAFAGTATSHAHCTKNFRESMHALSLVWKRKVAALRKKGDANPEYDAAKGMWVTYRNVYAAHARCMRSPLVKLKPPGPSSKF